MDQHWVIRPCPHGSFAPLHENGVMMTIGTDWPVTDDPNVFPAVQGLLDRGYESLPLEQALKMLTINGAISMGWQDPLGSLETGKIANMIVLDRSSCLTFPVRKSALPWY